MKRSKYGIAPAADRTVDGITLNSKGEMLRWLHLKLLERAGEISHLRRQPVSPIVLKGLHVCDYEADFAYTANGVEITEDFKGVRTAVFNLKRKLMKAVWGIDIRLTGARPKRKVIPRVRYRAGVI